MIWREIFLNKNRNKEDIIKAFSNIFDVDINEINLIDNISGFRSNDALTCVVNILLGDFYLRLDCFTSFKIENEFNVISQLSTIINCGILISNDNDEDKDNPYSFILFESSGQIKRVEVEARLLDEHDELKIREETPYLNE